MNSAELQSLSEGLGALVLPGLGSISKWHLEIAISAAARDGVEGLLTLKIPRRVKDECEIRFTPTDPTT